MKPYSIVSNFEETIADYAGSNYAVAVSSCTNAIFLCCKYMRLKNKWVHIPKFTYPGVAHSILHSGAKLSFTDEVWQGVYRLRPYHIYDGALRFKRGMHIKHSLYCLSFHYKKHISIGRGGMILTDSIDAYEWFKKARFDGRPEAPLSDDNRLVDGYNMYMTPEQAARGLTFFSFIENMDLPDLKFEDQGYPDLSKMGVFKIQ